MDNRHTIFRDTHWREDGPPTTPLQYRATAHSGPVGAPNQRPTRMSDKAQSQRWPSPFPGDLPGGPHTENQLNNQHHSHKTSVPVRQPK
jgi:hypothetical protein